MPRPGKLGKLPPLPEADAPRLKLARYLAPAPPPSAVDWYSKVAAWPMYLNDQIGDCTCAEVGHQIESASTYGESTTVELTDADVLALYEAVSGYRPSDPATDRGAVIQRVLGYWRRTGVAGHRLLAFAQVDHTNLPEVEQAVGLFGSLDLGMQVPAVAMTQTQAGQPWDVTGNDGAIEGGHCIELVGYDPTYAYVVTWGAIQKMTWAFWTKYVDESWAAILPEWLNAQGTDPQGLDLAALGADLTALTGAPDPFRHRRSRNREVS